MISNILDFQSEYLHVGRKHEDWRFRDVQVAQSGLTALMDISSPFISSHDREGFHLSIFTTQEACVELLVFWICQKACIQSKPGEAWMKEMSSSCSTPIRDSQDIRIELDVKKSRVGNGFLYAVGCFKIEGPNGGLFNVELKGLMENHA